MLNFTGHVELTKMYHVLNGTITSTTNTTVENITELLRVNFMQKRSFKQPSNETFYDLAKN